MSCRTRFHECSRLSTLKKALSRPLHTFCRNVPDDPETQTARAPRPFQVPADKLANLEPVRSDREFFLSVKSVYASATNVFLPVDQEKLHSAQAAEYGPYIDYYGGP